MGCMVLCRSHETIACSLYLKDLSNYHAILSMVEIPTLIKCTIVLPMTGSSLEWALRVPSMAPADILHVSGTFPDNRFGF